MKRIVIIHPEGNILNNPNLTGIVEILCEQGYLVDIYSPPRKFYQAAPCPGSRLISQEYFPLTGPYARLVSKLSNIRGMQWMRKLAKHPYVTKHFYKLIPADLVIGVDQEGIIEASMMAKAKNIPYGFISYEIFFEEETSEKIKKKERDACKGICFAICQDPLRSEHLTKENHIPSEKIINIPVAGQGVKREKKTHYLHDALGIDRDKHIALFMGSVHTWTRIYDVLEYAKDWSDEWVLVIHPRFGLDDATQTLYEQYKDTPKIFFSFDPLPHYRDFSKLIKSADIGIALYQCDFCSRYTGNNIKYLGMASGKVATYLQHGIPVVINEVGMLSEYVKKYKLGFVVTDNITLPSPYELQEYKERCYQFFEQMLDLNTNIQPLLSKIRQLLEDER